MLRPHEWNSGPDDLIRSASESWLIRAENPPVWKPVRSKIVALALEHAHSTASAALKSVPMPPHENLATVQQIAESISRIEKTLHVLQETPNLPRVARAPLAFEQLQTREHVTRQLNVSCTCSGKDETELRRRLSDIDLVILQALRGPMAHVVDELFAIGQGSNQRALALKLATFFYDSPENKRWTRGEDNRGDLKTLFYDRSRERRAQAVSNLVAAFSSRGEKRNAADILKPQETLLLLAACAHGYAGVEVLPAIVESFKLMERLSSENYSETVKGVVDETRCYATNFLFYLGTLDLLGSFERTEVVKALHAVAPQVVRENAQFESWSSDSMDELRHGIHAFVLTALKLGFIQPARSLTPKEILGGALTETGVDIRHPLAELGLEVIAGLDSTTRQALSLVRQALQECLADGGVPAFRVARSAIHGLGELSLFEEDSELLARAANLAPLAADAEEALLAIALRRRECGLEREENESSPDLAEKVETSDPNGGIRPGPPR